MVDWNLAVNVTVTGIVLVFLMLLLLVLILYIFGAISVGITKSKDKKASIVKAKAYADMISNTDSKPISTAQPEDSDEIIAVISAAVSALYSGKKVKPVIKSIKKSSTRRSAWANAGISDNTKAF